MTEPIFLYVTAPDQTTADRLGELLVRDKLAACVNIFTGMRSIFQWDGKIERAEECVMIVKTTKCAASVARNAIIDAHPYDTPCVIALPVDPSASSKPFMDWIQAETSQNSPQNAG